MCMMLHARIPRGRFMLQLRQYGVRRPSGGSYVVESNRCCPEDDVLDAVLSEGCHPTSGTRCGAVYKCRRARGFL